MVAIYTSSFNNQYSTLYIDGFCVILIVNSDYFLKQRLQIDRCNGEV
jgi:hypothetical protein